MSKISTLKLPGVYDRGSSTVASRAFSLTQDLKNAVDVNGVLRLAVLLVVVKIGLAIGHDSLGVGVDGPLESFVISRSLRAEPPLEALLHGEHLDVVDAVPAARFGCGAGRQREVLVLRDVRGDVRTQRDGEIALPTLCSEA